MEKRAESLTPEELQQQNEKLVRQNAELSAKLRWYEEQFRLAQHKRFDASSEKTHPDQLELNLFNEAEMLATPPGEEPPMEKITYERRKQTGKREDDLSDLPVETVVYTLEEGKQSCACCGGSLHEMSTETRSEVAVVLPQVKVVRHVRHVYSCRHCERNEVQTPIVTAPAPKPVYPGSLASPSILSHVMCQKYVDSLPLYRQEQIFARLGYTLSRQTMANWMIYGAEQWLAPLVAVLKVILLRQSVLHADETTLQVLKEPNKSAESKSYLRPDSVAVQGLGFATNCLPLSVIGPRLRPKNEKQRAKPTASRWWRLTGSGSSNNDPGRHPRARRVKQSPTA